MEKKIEDILKVLEEKGEWTGPLTILGFCDLCDGARKTMTKATYNQMECMKGRKVRNKEAWKYTIKIETGKPVEEEEEETEGSGFFPF